MNKYLCVTWIVRKYKKNIIRIIFIEYWLDKVAYIFVKLLDDFLLIVDAWQNDFIQHKAKKKNKSMSLFGQIIQFW